MRTLKMLAVVFGLLLTSIAVELSERELKRFTGTLTK